MGRICHTGLPQKISQILGHETEVLGKHAVSPKVYFSPISFKQIPISLFLQLHHQKETKVQKKQVLDCQGCQNNVSQTGYHAQEKFIFFFKSNFIFFFLLFWVFVAAQTFLQLWRAAVTLQLWCTSFSLWWLLLLQSMGSRAHSLQQFCLPGSTAQAQQLWCRGQLLRGMQDLLRSGIEPLSSALAGKFCTTELPGKPQKFIF